MSVDTTVVPYCIEGTEQDARNAAREEAVRAIDCDGDCVAGDDEFHATAGSLDDSGDYWLDNGDCGYISTGGLHIWYVACDTPEECAAVDCRESGNPCDARLFSGACPHR